MRSIFTTLCLALAACGGGQRPAASTSTPTSAPTKSLPTSTVLASADVTTPPAPTPIAPQRTNMTGGKEKSMAKCPSAVAGAVTRYAPTKDGAELTITASSADDAFVIQAVAGTHVRMHEPDPSKRLHSSDHAGPGTIGYCPIVHKGTKVSIERIAKGVRVHIVAIQADAVPALQTMIRERVDALPDGAH